MKIFLAVAALILLWGMIGDKDADNRRNYTLGFIVCVAGVILLEIYK